MFYVYVLKSVRDGDLYVGVTSDLRRRLREHQEKKSRSTSPRAPFILCYYEAYRSHDDARHREDALKLRGQARKHLMTRISRSLKDES
ncbi:GIY-YIG nuclease family protein [Patescibacteria group bacterium]|nr:GIY-YIG nuclease family protein [Patescibacteria group bacterium]